jgi:hypothetical protein
MRHTDPRLTETTYIDETLLPIAAELAELPAFEGISRKPLAQNRHKTRGTHRQGGAKTDTSGHNDRMGQNEEIARKAVSEVAYLTRLGTNRQGPASGDTEPFQERVKGVEPSTFTLAT